MTSWTEKDFQEVEETMRKEDEFLRNRGWRYLEDEKLWLDLSGQKVAVRAAFHFGFHDHLRELGWETFRVERHIPKYLNFRESWQPTTGYIHPESKRIYSYTEAHTIVLELSNDESRFNQSDICDFTKMERALTVGHDVRPGCLVKLEMTQRAAESICDRYSLDSIEYRD